MKRGKNRVVPIIITVVVIVIIICLFATVKQPLVVCSRKTRDNLDIVLSEELEATIDGKKIESMILTKTIILPDKYLNDGESLDMIVESLKKSYRYLGEEKVVITKGDDRVIVRVVVQDDETIILNNIKFFDKNGLVMEINPNTKSSDVITLKVDDNYSEGELKTRMKNSGYSCK